MKMEIEKRSTSKIESRLINIKSTSFFERL